MDRRVAISLFMTRPTVAVLGLGLIGSIWKNNYEEAGVLKACWNRTPKTDEFGWKNQPEDCLADADIIHLCLYDPSSVESVLEKLLPHLEPRHVIVQSTTIDPVHAGKFCKMVLSSGANYVEAPFTGSKPAAVERKTVFYLGGEEKTISKVAPVLEILSQKTFRLDNPTQAATVKLAMNLQIAGMTQALCETIFITRKAGVSDDLFFALMKNNVAWSGLAELKEPKLRAHDYEPQFSVQNMHKDMKLAQQTLSSSNYPLLQMVVEQLSAAGKAGYAQDDFLSLYRLLGEEK